MYNPVENRKEGETSNPDISYGKGVYAKRINKGKKSHYGYKVFASVDDEHSFIQTVHTESAEAHRLETMLEDLNCEHLLAYRTQKIERLLTSIAKKIGKI